MLWFRLAAAAPIPPLVAWELPYATGTALKERKGKEKEKKEKKRKGREEKGREEERKGKWLLSLTRLVIHKRKFCFTTLWPFLVFKS